jgi:hypothetical protein
LSFKVSFRSFEVQNSRTVNVEIALAKFKVQNNVSPYDFEKQETNVELRSQLLRRKVLKTKFSAVSR